MKKIILSIASLCMTGIAFGQWSTSGNNTISTNSGYIGLNSRFLLQGTNTSNNNWSRGHIAEGAYWDNTNNWWQVGMPGDLNTDFSIMRFTNSGGALSFYTNGNTGAAYHLTDAQIDGYRRFTINNTGIEVNGLIGFTPSTSNIRSITGNSEIGIALYGNTDVTSGAGIIAYSNNAPGTTGRIDLVAGIGNATTTSNNTAYNFMYYAGNNVYSSYISIFRDGKVTMGNITNRPGDYKLYVEKGILTEKVRVAVQGTSYWADHVFADNYELKSLDEVEGYIKENKHLPEIPSAKDVVKNGVDLGAMDAKLLQKIEELTLYVIQQQKEIEQLKKQVNK